MKPFSYHLFISVTFFGGFLSPEQFATLSNAELRVWMEVIESGISLGNIQILG